ncbi:hypothetical protein N7470_002982 [Penicillium chermesinum]|nr:hypothetical protein N7470_002982 [Penicillium chermesinum]
MVLPRPAPASFKPFPPDLDIKKIVEANEHFRFVDRITCDSINKESFEALERLILLWVVLLGRPLVIDGFQEFLCQDLFSATWLSQNHTKNEEAQDLTEKNPLPLSVKHYLNEMPKLAERAARLYEVEDSGSSRGPRAQRLYLKDMDCPPDWHEYLARIIPPFLFYLNQGPRSFSGPGSGNVNLSDLPTTKDGEPIAAAGDLMSSLPHDMRAANLMCYIGHEGTYTPAHQEMCASIGHNIMVEASDGSVENQKQTMPGSSIWFMTKTPDRRTVSKYWTTELGHNIDLEDHFAQLGAWMKAPFETYVVEQKPGDLILVPPLAAHQVWNRGTRTMKVAWNRTTVETLEMAMDEALEHARIICRDEQYKNKAIVYFTLHRYHALLHDKSAAIDHKKLYKDILLSEMFSPKLPGDKIIETIEYRGNVTCSYCRCNIFNRFLTCPTCTADEGVAGEVDDFDICMDCYVLGRSCRCISRLKWVQQFPLKDLRDQYAKWRNLILSFEKDDQESARLFPPLHNAHSQLPRKTVAHICQEQLRIRPWIDWRNKGDESSSVHSDPQEQPTKRRKMNKKRNAASCHMCKTCHPAWKMARCENCEQHYCFADLFRAFDTTPQNVMEDTVWICPQCSKICNCSSCRQSPLMDPYVPRRLLLGHDTTKVADRRSVESMVSLLLPNLKWLPRLESSNHAHQEKQLVENQTRNQKLMGSPVFMEWKQQVSLNGNDGALQDQNYIPVDPQLQLDSSTPR